MKKRKNWSLIKSKLSTYTGVFTLAVMSNVASANTLNECVIYANGEAACTLGTDAYSATPTWQPLVKTNAAHKITHIHAYQDKISGIGQLKNSYGDLLNVYFYKWGSYNATPSTEEDRTQDAIWYGASSYVRYDEKVIDISCSILHNIDDENAEGLYGYGACSTQPSGSYGNSKGNKVYALADKKAWRIGANGTLGYTSDVFGTQVWTTIPGPNSGSLDNISVDYRTLTVCGSNSANQIFCSDNPNNQGASITWRQIPGTARSVSVYNGKLWRVGTDGKVYYKPDTTTTDNWLAQGNSNVVMIAVSGTGSPVAPPAPEPTNQNIHACVRYLNGSAACANGNSAYTATPTMVNLSKISDANRISMLNIDRHYPVGLGATTAITNAIYDWAGVVATPTISSDTNTTGQKIVWFSSGVNITNSKVYQCRALEDGKVSCKDKDSSTWLNLAHSTIGFKHLALANSHIWGIAKDNTIWYKRSYLNPANDWVLVPGILVNLTVDYKTNTICGNNTANDIYCSDWPSNTGNGVGWRGIAGKANSVAVFERKMWVVGLDNYLYHKPDTSSNGNWIKTNVSSLAQVTVSGISDISSGTDLDNGLTWKAQGDKYVSFTTNKQDVQCASNDGRTCLTNITLEQAKQSTIPLVCGAMLKTVSGITGYNTSGHWCHTAANGWIWSPQVGGIFWKMTSGGDPQCAANDGRNCFWWSNHNLEWVVSAATRPLTCGNNHFWQYWTTGYKPGHWCQYLKDNAGSSTLW